MKTKINTHKEASFLFVKLQDLLNDYENVQISITVNDFTKDDVEEFCRENGLDIREPEGGLPYYRGNLFHDSNSLTVRTKNYTLKKIYVQEDKEC